MTVPSSPVVLPLALVAGALVLTVAACGGSAGQPPGNAGTTGSAPVPASGPASPAGSVGPASASSPSTPAPSGTTSGPTGGTCPVGALRLRYADVVGSAGAGSVAGTFTFTNTGTAACTLRGFPGVSYVGGSDKTQVGEAATRTDDAVKTRTLAPGTKVTAALRRSQPGSYGPECHETKVDGFRVFPPGSTDSAFVPFETTGCTSTTAPLLQVGPVR